MFTAKYEIPQEVFDRIEDAGMSDNNGIMNVKKMHAEVDVCRAMFNIPEDQMAGLHKLVTEY